jgi:hypothetical protein
LEFLVFFWHGYCPFKKKIKKIESESPNFFSTKENNMKRWWRKTIGLAGMILWFLPEMALASGEKADLIVIVADTRRLSGWQAWWANLYNESHLYFTIITVITIPLVGLILGLMADFVMKRIGIDLTSRDLAEH